MANMDVSLPGLKKDQVEHDQERRTKIAELQRQVDAGLTSGISVRTPDEIRQLGRDRLAAVQAG